MRKGDEKKGMDNSSVDYYIRIDALSVLTYFGKHALYHGVQ